MFVRRNILAKAIFNFLFCFLLTVSCISSSALEWTTYQNIPAPAPGSFGVVGTALPSGHLVLWNGDSVYVQNALDADGFTAIASGYSGDPAFITLSPDGHTLALGAGIGDYTNPPAWKDSIYYFDLDNPVDNSQAVPVLVEPHFECTFLDENLLLIDRSTSDFMATELVIVNFINPVKSSRQTVLTTTKLSDNKDIVSDKPQFSYSGKVTVDHGNGIVYVIDSNTRELRYFSLSALQNAYQTQSQLSWETDGTLVGAAGDFYSSGVVGITPEGNLVISGSEGYLAPGGIQLVNPNLVDPAQAFVISTEDPAGNQPFYAGFYSVGADTITAYDYINWYASVPALSDGQYHNADVDKDSVLSLQELLRIIQFYNVGSFSCADARKSTGDGYQPGDKGLRNCAAYASDNSPRDWQLSLTELLQAIQLYNLKGYCACNYGNDGEVIQCACTHL